VQLREALDGGEDVGRRTGRGRLLRGPGERGPAPPMSTPKAYGPVRQGQRGILSAWDPATQKERWFAPVGGQSGGGALSTAGNLVFQVTPQGSLLAYTADKGEKLLEIQTNLRGAMGPPMTFMLDGKQYVSLQGGQGAAGSGFGGGAASPILPKLLTFVLDGTARLAPANP